MLSPYIHYQGYITPPGVYRGNAGRFDANKLPQVLTWAEIQFKSHSINKEDENMTTRCAQVGLDFTLYCQILTSSLCTPGGV